MIKEGSKDYVLGLPTLGKSISKGEQEGNQESAVYSRSQERQYFMEKGMINCVNDATEKSSSMRIENDHWN